MSNENQGTWKLQVPPRSGGRTKADLLADTIPWRLYGCDVRVTFPDECLVTTTFIDQLLCRLLRDGRADGVLFDGAITPFIHAQIRERATERGVNDLVTVDLVAIVTQETE